MTAPAGRGEAGDGLREALDEVLCRRLPDSVLPEERAALLDAILALPELADLTRAREQVAASCWHPFGCQAPGEGCSGPCPVSPAEGARIERDYFAALDGDTTTGGTA